jgi:hypothetical protein
MSEFTLLRVAITTSSRLIDPFTILIKGALTMNAQTTVLTPWVGRRRDDKIEIQAD